MVAFCVYGVDFKGLDTWWTISEEFSTVVFFRKWFSSKVVFRCKSAAHAGSSLPW